MPFRGSSFGGRSSSWSSSSCCRSSTTYRSYSTYTRPTYTRPLVVQNNHYHYGGGGYGYHGGGGFGSSFFGGFAGSWLGNAFGYHPAYGVGGGGYAAGGTTSVVGQPGDPGYVQQDNPFTDFAIAFGVLGFVVLCVFIGLFLIKFAIKMFED